MNPIVPDGYDVFGIVLIIALILVIVGGVVWLVRRSNRHKGSSSLSSDHARDGRDHR